MKEMPDIFYIKYPDDGNRGYYLIIKESDMWVWINYSPSTKSIIKSEYNSTVDHAEYDYFHGDTFYNTVDIEYTDIPQIVCLEAFRTIFFERG